MQTKTVGRCHCPPCGTDVLETEAPRVGKAAEKPEAARRWWEGPVVWPREQCGPCDSAPPLRHLPESSQGLAEKCPDSCIPRAPNWKRSSRHHPVCV